MNVKEFRIAFSQAVAEDDYPLFDTGIADISDAGLTHLTNVAEAAAEPLFDAITALKVENAELKTRIAELEEQANGLHELFKATMSGITGQVESALGYTQLCSAPHAVHRLAERYQEAKAALEQYANDRRQK